ncbi:MAG: serine hydrolase [Proteobacteria bacterium]|nr:serine hydrolase [Pseudomonadota bacterium]
MPGLFALCLGCAATAGEQSAQSPTNDQAVTDTAQAFQTTQAPEPEMPARSPAPANTGISPAQTTENIQSQQAHMPENATIQNDNAAEHTANPPETPPQADIALNTDPAEITQNPPETQPRTDTSLNTDTPEDKHEPPPPEAHAADILQPAQADPEAIKALHTEADWFVPEASRKWYKQTSRHANRKYLSEYFKLIGYEVPKHTYALIAPLQTRGDKLSMQYYSYLSTAFEYSMTKDGEEKYWPASTVKLAAAVMALLKLREYKAGSKSVVSFTDLEGHYEDTVEKLCRDAIIPSNNTAYNRLMEIAGFDEINDHYLREVFHFPKMVLQRRYVRHRPEDSLRDSPEIQFSDGNVNGTIPERHSSGKMRPECPRESNCTTLAELGEVMFRVVLHEELPKKRQLALPSAEINMLREALVKAPSCIGDGITAAMGPGITIYNKGGKVIGDDRLEVAVVSTPDKRERYLVALSMPYYEGVEKETNRLAMHLISAMRAR